MSVKDLLKKFIGKYVTVLFIPAGDGASSEVDGYLEEVNDNYLVLRYPDGRRIYLFNVVVYGIEVYEK